MFEIMNLLDALLSQDLILNSRVTWCWKHFSDISHTSKLFLSISLMKVAALLGLLQLSQLKAKFQVETCGHAFTLN